MGRKRREIRPDGHLLCTRCKEWRHISEYYQHSYGGFSIYWSDGTNVYGKPLSYCIPCMRGYSKNRAQRLTDLSEVPDETDRHDTFNLADADIEGLTAPNGVRGSADHRAATQSP